MQTLLVQSEFWVQAEFDARFAATGQVRPAVQVPPTQAAPAAQVIAAPLGPRPSLRIVFAPPVPPLPAEPFGTRALSGAATGAAGTLAQRLLESAQGSSPTLGAQVMNPRDFTIESMLAWLVAQLKKFCSAVNWVAPWPTMVPIPGPARSLIRSSLVAPLSPPFWRKRRRASR